MSWVDVASDVGFLLQLRSLSLMFLFFNFFMCCIACGIAVSDQG